MGFNLDRHHALIGGGQHGECARRGIVFESAHTEWKKVDKVAFNSSMRRLIVYNILSLVAVTTKPVSHFRSTFEFLLSQPDLLETTPPAPSSPPLSDVPVSPESWYEILCKE
jgi:hypothetical protein